MLFLKLMPWGIEEPPDRPEPRLLLTLVEQTALDLFQRQIGFLPNQLEQPVLVFAAIGSGP